MQSTIPIATPPPLPQLPVQQKTSNGKWAALTIALAVVTLFAAGAAKWAKNAKLAAKSLNLPAPTAPKLPDFAFTQATSDAEPPASAPSSLASVTTPASAISPETHGSDSPALPNPPVSMSATTAASLGSEPKTPAVSTTSGPQPMGSVLRGSGPSYIWVARYDREDRAQDASRKIQSLGLTSVVIPRPAEKGKHAYVVVSGPFPPSRIPSVIDWLRTQGFTNVREVKMPNGPLRGNLAPKTSNDFDGSSE